MDTERRVLAEDSDQLWMRVRYRMPPSDPRLLSLTALDILIEREKVEMFSNEGRLLQFCKACGIQTFRNCCPLCGEEDTLEIGPTGDPVIDDLIAQDPEGKIIDLDALFPPIPRQSESQRKQ